MLSSATGADSSPTPKKGKTKDVIPFGELELATVALKAADAWDASPLLPLLWCSKAQFRAAAVAFMASIGTADGANDDLGPNAARLAELDVLIDKSLKFVRNFLLEEHATKATAKTYYDGFGLEPDGQMRTARPARAKDLAKLVAALQASGYDQGKYGTAFWQPILKYQPIVTTVQLVFY